MPAVGVCGPGAALTFYNPGPGGVLLACEQCGAAAYRNLGCVYCLRWMAAETPESALLRKLLEHAETQRAKR